MQRTRLQVERARIVYRALREARALGTPPPAPTGHPIPLDELAATLRGQGVSSGDLLHVQSSLAHLYRGWPIRSPDAALAPADYAGRVVELLLDLIGPTGTLVMNTDSLRFADVDRAWAGRIEPGAALFDYARSPTRRGLIAELFRRREGTVRSVHPWYNMAASGPLADELVRDHHLSTPYTMDSHSPTCKLTLLGGKVALLGDGYVGNVPLHLVEYLHPDEYPRPIFMNRPVAMTYMDRDRQVRSIDVLLHAAATYISGDETTRFTEHLQERHGIYRRRDFVGGVSVVAYDARVQYDVTLQEMRGGFCLYDPEFR